jgi:hypothetical protein
MVIEEPVQHRTPLKISTAEEPLWLCFEPWANEYTVPSGTTIVIVFDTEQAPVEVMHHADGITFFSLGRHPDIYSDDGCPLEILSETMPSTPTDLSSDPAAVFKTIMSLAPPVRDLSHGHEEH